jgi:hypothetical protein
VNRLALLVAVAAILLAAWFLTALPADALAPMP